MNMEEPGLPVIDIEFNSQEILSETEVQSPFRIRRWLSIKSIGEKLSRMNFEIRSFSQFMMDKLILNKIPERYVDSYIKIIPYILQAFTLVPVFFIVSKINDEVFTHLHFILSPLRILSLCTYPFWKYPIRLGFSALSTFLSVYIPSFMLFDSKYTYKLVSRNSPKWFSIWFRNTNFFSIMRNLTLFLALSAEVFGEAIPSDRLLAYKPPISKVSKTSLCNKTYLTSLLSQKYDSNNLPLLDLMLDQDKDFIIELEIIPDFPHCIGEKSLKQKVLIIKNSQRRKTLRIRSKSHAKKTRNSIKRILLY